MAVSSGDEEVAVRRSKSASAFRTISEVAEELDIPQHVLRFWETKFGQIRPLKRGGGRRYYRPEDVLLLQRIRRLLYDEGYTIKGVQRLLRDSGRTVKGAAVPAPAAVAAEPEAPAEAAEAADELLDEANAEIAALRAALEEALNELVVLRAILKTAEKRGFTRDEPPAEA
ncbi:MerR family transcriptional regulator [Stella sp.]|uniref:MerR family transcriptional regulator n=1 Tax=Stella sp. TaxID=2912054 RepID=UPI0035B35BA4